VLVTSTCVVVDSTLEPVNVLDTCIDVVDSAIPLVVKSTVVLASVLTGSVDFTGMLMESVD
jgi:hypothetical protein